MSDEKVNLDTQFTGRVSLDKNDVRWIAQTIHNAYHNPPEGKGGHWSECPKSVCAFVRDVLKP